MLLEKYLILIFDDVFRKLPERVVNRFFDLFVYTSKKQQLEFNFKL